MGRLYEVVGKPNLFILIGYIPLYPGTMPFRFCGSEYDELSEGFVTEVSPLGYAKRRKFR